MLALGRHLIDGTRLTEVVDRMQRFLRTGVTLHDDALPTLRELRRRGIRTAVVSNCDHLTGPVVEPAAGTPAGLAATLPRIERAAGALATAARAMLDGAPGGTHHFSGAPDISWADFARAIMAQTGLHCRIDDIATSAYPTPARRPLNSRLDCSAFTAAFGARERSTSTTDAAAHIVERGLLGL